MLEIKRAKDAGVTFLTLEQENPPAELKVSGWKIERELYQEAPRQCRKCHSSFHKTMFCKLSLEQKLCRSCSDTCEKHEGNIIPYICKRPRYCWICKVSGHGPTDKKCPKLRIETFVLNEALMMNLGRPNYRREYPERVQNYKDKLNEELQQQKNRQQKQQQQQRQQQTTNMTQTRTDESAEMWQNPRNKKKRAPRETVPSQTPPENVHFEHQRPDEHGSAETNTGANDEQSDKVKESETHERTRTETHKLTQPEDEDGSTQGEREEKSTNGENPEEEPRDSTHREKDNKLKTQTSIPKQDTPEQGLNEDTTNNLVGDKDIVLEETTEVTQNPSQMSVQQENNNVLTEQEYNPSTGTKPKIKKKKKEKTATENQTVAPQKTHKKAPNEQKSPPTFGVNVEDPKKGINCISKECSPTTTYRNRECYQKHKEMYHDRNHNAKRDEKMNRWKVPREHKCINSYKCINLYKIYDETNRKDVFVDDDYAEYENIREFRRGKKLKKKALICTSPPPQQSAKRGLSESPPSAGGSESEQPQEGEKEEKTLPTMTSKRAKANPTNVETDIQTPMDQDYMSPYADPDDLMEVDGPALKGMESTDHLKYWPCLKCKRRFSSSRNLERHTTEKHLQCNRCGKKTENLLELENHKTDKHPTCEECGEDFNNQQELTDHSIVKHLKYLPRERTSSIHRKYYYEDLERKDWKWLLNKGKIPPHKQISSSYSNEEIHPLPPDKTHHINRRPGNWSGGSSHDEKLHPLPPDKGMQYASTTGTLNPEQPRDTYLRKIQTRVSSRDPRLRERKHST